MSLVLLQTLTQVMYYLRKGETVCFYRRGLFRGLYASRLEGDVVAVFVYPFNGFGHYGDEIFFEVKRDYQWIENNFPRFFRSFVTPGIRLRKNASPDGFFKLLSAAIALLLGQKI